MTRDSQLVLDIWNPLYFKIIACVVVTELIQLKQDQRYYSLNTNYLKH